MVKTELLYETSNKQKNSNLCMIIVLEHCNIKDSKDLIIMHFKCIIHLKEVFVYAHVYRCG